MKTRLPLLSRFDPGWGLLLVLLVGALWPFVSRAGLPVATDAELHVFRLAALARLVGEGAIYPRWVPEFYYGYGYPIFNYYAPLSYYAGLPLALLPGLGAVAGVKFVFCAALVGGAAGLYGYARALWGRPAGLLAAAAFAYAPYIQYVDPHARGDLAEAFSFGVFPLALWALDAYRRRGGGGAWFAGTLGVAAIILSHNLMAMVFFALLLAWWVWQLLGARLAPDPAVPLRRLAWVLAALLLGVVLSAFFWLPVALEQNAIDLRTLIGAGAGDNFDFRNHFLSLRTLLSPSLRLDWGATEPRFLFNLGVGQWLLALLGATLLAARRVTRERWQAAFFVVSALALVFMTLPLSQPVWEWVPLLPLMQFPWRLLGPLALLLALPAAAAMSALTAWRPRLPWGAAGLLLLLLPALPLTQVPPWSADFGPTDRAATILVELQGRWLGTTSTSDFVPATVDMIPGPNSEVAGVYMAGGVPDRVNRATLPAGTTVTAQQVGALRWRYDVAGTEPFLLRFFLFDFPGWEARIDGLPATTQLARPEGFLVVEVPAGSHEVTLRFVDTPPRRAAWLISGAGLLLALAAWWWLRRRPFHDASAADPPPLTSPLWPMAAALALAYGVLLVAAPGLRLESSGTVALPAETALQVDLAAAVWLLGFDAPAVVTAGEPMTVTLYWKAQRPLSDNYQVFVHLLDASGAVVAQSDKINPGEFPTERWPLDKYVRDEHVLVIEAGLPAGAYRLTAGLWDFGSGVRLPISGGASSVADAALLQTITVEDD